MERALFEAQPAALARSLVIVAPLTSEIRGLWSDIEPGKRLWLPKSFAVAVNTQGHSDFDPNQMPGKLGTLGQGAEGSRQGNPAGKLSPFVLRGQRGSAENGT